MKGKPIIVVDAGHGMGNRIPGRYDPGAVRYQVNGKGPPMLQATEASMTLDYGLALEAALRSRGYAVQLTRHDQKEPASLGARVQIAKRVRAALLVSLHLNADPDPDGPKDPQARGHEVLYVSPESEPLACALSQALQPLIPAHGTGVVNRFGSDLAVLKFKPSVLVELGFIDSDPDWALLSDPEWKAKACEAMAAAIESQVPSPRSQVSSLKSQVAEEKT